MPKKKDFFGGVAILNLIRSILVPGGAVLLGAIFFLNVLATPTSLVAIAQVSPYLVLGVGILLGWRFNRSRMILAIVLLVLADRMLRHFGMSVDCEGKNQDFVYLAVCLLLPLNLSIISCLRERGVFATQGVLRLILLVSQIPVLALIGSLAPVWAIGGLSHRFVEDGFVAWVQLPQPALFAFGGSFLLMAMRLVFYSDALESGFLWVLTAAFLALKPENSGTLTTIYLNTAGLILVISLVETSYLLAYRDELTKLPARRSLNEALLKLGNRYVVAMVDVDHFKNFNDQYGHDVGDQVLQMVASRIAKVSGGGKGYRYGGEEFAIIFPNKSLGETILHLENLRQTIENSMFVLRAPDRPRKKPQTPRPGKSPGKTIGVTVSIGVAERDHIKVKPDHVLKAADKALYRAKDGGRNQVSK